MCSSHVFYYVVPLYKDRKQKAEDICLLFICTKNTANKIAVPDGKNIRQPSERLFSGTARMFCCLSVKLAKVYYHVRNLVAKFERGSLRAELVESIPSQKNLAAKYELGKLLSKL